VGTGIPKYNQIVVDMVKDPASPPDHIVLQGYPGEDTKHGFLRMYLVLDFSCWVEVAEEDVVYHETPGQPQYPTVIWIKRTAKIDYYEHSSLRELPAQYLEGQIARASTQRPPEFVFGSASVTPYWCSHR
jgi:hypothetical protein